MNPDTSTFPKTVWFLWLQGEAELPYRGQKCLQSWKHWNPGWTLRFLSDENLREYLPDLDEIIGRNRDIIKLQAISDIIRINILNRYGGVWVDATCLCRKSLEEWLPNCLQEGFFAFRNPGKDRMIASWFMAATPRSLITQSLCDAVNCYWKENHFRKRSPSGISGFLNRNRFLPIFWSSWYVTKVKRAYPYYWFHYLFARRYYLDSLFRQKWSKVPFLEASPMLRLNTLNLDSPLDPETKQWIDHSELPCFKLSSRSLPTAPAQGTIRHYLLKAPA